ncbi:MAG: hypothetical protein IKL59_08770 [Clostridia bacterium]|nr:hypothetical protein [Clostridia bacterium]
MPTEDSYDTEQNNLAGSDITQSTTIPSESSRIPEYSVPEIKVTSLTTYEALGYEMSVGVNIDYDKLKMYTSEKFHVEAITNKENVLPKSTTLFSQNISTTYRRTKMSASRDYAIDEYGYVVGKTHAFISYRSDTDTIVEFDISPTNDINYSSPVNPQSTEAEYIAYAKKALSEITGQSTEGWKIKIESYHKSYGTTYQFVNYTDASTVGQYTFTFYKTIDGIERYDKMYVKMTNAGEIFAINAINSDAAFDIYRDVNIDSDKVDKAIWDAFAEASKKTVTSKKIDSKELVVNDDGLWVEAAVSYNIDGDWGGIIFVIQVAEIENDAAVSSGKVKLTGKETVSAIETTTE